MHTTEFFNIELIVDFVAVITGAVLLSLPTLAFGAFMVSL